MANVNNYGLFLPTTYTFDVAQLYEVEVNSPEFKELLVRLYQNISNMIVAINNKDSAFYEPTEFINGQTYFPNPTLSSLTPQSPARRQVFRTVVNFGALPNTGTKSVAHNIVVTNTFSFTRMYGAASDTTGLQYIPLPYASPVLANNIELRVDATNVYITTGSNRSNFNICYVILEYLKQ